MILLGLVSIVWDLGVIDIKFYCFKNNHFYKKKKSQDFKNVMNLGCWWYGSLGSGKLAVS